MITLSTSTPTVYGTVGVMKKLTPRTFVVRGILFIVLSTGWDNKNITWNCCGKYLSTAEAATACHDDDHNNGIYAIDNNGISDNRQRR